MQLHREKDRIHAAGAELVVVGNGAPHFIQAFREDTGLSTPLFTDPTLATYRALEFRRGAVATVLSPRTWAHALRAFRAGFRQVGVKGDAFQLGGVLVVRPDGEVLYRYASAEAGDHPEVEELLRAIPGGPQASGSTPQARG